MKFTDFDPAQVAAESDLFVPTVIQLSPQRCADLLRHNRWGRIAIATPGWPTIRPINFAFDDHDIVFRTGHSGYFSDTTLTAVALEIDDAEPAGEWGWSVIVEGTALDITNTLTLRSTPLPSSLQRAWAPGLKDRWIRLTMDRISGVAFGPVPWLSMGLD